MNDFYKFATCCLVVFMLATDLPMVVTLLVSAIIMVVFIIPLIDFTKDLSIVLSTNKFSNETIWKLLTLVAMFFCFTSILHKPITMLFEKSITPP